jgi:GH15 family glucan-1,4-alpha-glucosidase
MAPAARYRAQAIQDYGIIGDGRAAALVSRTGSIDWLCWPRFDSPSIFAALLDDDAGRWSIAPRAPFRSERRYLDGTNVLETRFHTDTGTVVLTDLMPVASQEDQRIHTLPDHELVQTVRCESGETDVEMVFVPRPGYARRPPRPPGQRSNWDPPRDPSGLLVLLIIAGYLYVHPEERDKYVGATSSASRRLSGGIAPPSLSQFRSSNHS